MKRIFGTVMLFSLTLGWWGFVYPELCLTPEECSKEQDMTQESSSSGQIIRISGEETICIKSRLYEYICQYKEAAYEQ